MHIHVFCLNGSFFIAHAFVCVDKQLDCLEIVLSNRDRFLKLFCGFLFDIEYIVSFLNGTKNGILLLRC